MSKWRRPPSRPAPVVARLRGEFAAPVLAPVDAGAISSPLGVKNAEPHHSRHDLEPTRKPRSAGAPSPPRARFLAALLRGDFAAPVLALVDAGAISSPLGVVFAEPHHSRHDLAPTTPPGSAGGPPPMSARFLAALLRGEFAAPVLAPVDAGAISSPLDV